MKIPMIKPPKDVDIILNMEAEEIASIDDMDLASAMQYKLSQLILYVEQQYRIANSTLNEKSEYLNENWNRLASGLSVKASLTEKKAIALEQSDRLKEVKREVEEIRVRKELLEGWAEHLKGLSDVLKQVHYRLRLRDLGRD